MFATRADPLDQLYRAGSTPQLVRVPAMRFRHTGPYATEGPTVERLHAFIHDQGFDFDGRVNKHHEIYLSDPRRSAPEKLRTIIRQSYAGA